MLPALPTVRSRLAALWERVSTVRERPGAARERLAAGLERAVVGDHTTAEVAATFALGTFVVALPTAGGAIPLFAVVAYFSERASKLALAATLAVFNPPVKWAIYGGSYWIGERLLGPVPGARPTPETLRALDPAMGTEVLTRQLFGNLVFAVALAVVGYVVVYAAVDWYRRRRVEG